MGENILSDRVCHVGIVTNPIVPSCDDVFIAASIQEFFERVFRQNVLGPDGERIAEGGGKAGGISIRPW